MVCAQGEFTPEYICVQKISHASHHGDLSVTIIYH